MNIDSQQLISGYLDDVLSAEQHAQLNAWIKADPAHARAFAAAAWLHDRLQHEACIVESAPQTETSPRRLGRRSLVALASTACLVMLAAFSLWPTLGGRPVSAAMFELNRLIAANSQAVDRTFTIAVEETALGPPRANPRDPIERRPPKPSLDGAMLYVRGPRQFVLQRQLPDGRKFVTGSNGRTGWAARPDGPVRVSADLERFNHDVPGHEHAMPLSNLQDGLEQLKKAYDVEVLPVEGPDEGSAGGTEPSRLLVAVKKRGFRGPKRVEISYAASTGQIRQLRFIEMPYGPERLTLRVTLVDERDLGSTFFDHESHHDPERVVEMEE